MHNKKRKKIIKILFIISLLLITGYLNGNAIVYADDTYTCTGQNVSNFYCSLITSEYKTKYECTITKKDSGCDITCNKLTVEAIEQYGKTTNMSIDDCTKNDAAPATSKLVTSSSASPKATTGSTAPAPSSTSGSPNPTTGTTAIIIAMVLGLGTITYSFLYFRKIVNNDANKNSKD